MSAGNGNGNGAPKVNGARRVLRARPEAVDVPHPDPLLAEGEPDDDEGLGFLRRFVRELRDYGQLKHTPYGMKPAIILGLIVFFGRFDVAAFRIAGPVIARTLEIDVGDVINVQVIVGTVAVFVTIAIGWLADRTRRIPYVGIGTLFAGGFAVLTGRATSFATVATPRVFNDVASIAGSVPNFSLLADYYPPSARGRVFAMLGTLSRVGAVASVFTTGILLENVGLSTTFLIVGIPLSMMGIVALIGLREPIRGYMERKAMGADEEVARQEDEPQSLGESWRTTFGVRTIRRIVVAASFGGIGDSIVSLFFPFFLADKYGLGALESSMVLLPAVVAGVVGGIYGGGMIDRFTKVSPSRVLTLLAMYSLIAGLGVLMYVMRPPIVILIAANAIFGFGGALIGPARSVVYANVIPPSIRTTGLQMTALSELPGLIFAATLGGTILTKYDYAGVFLFAIPFLVVDALIQVTAAGFYDLDMRSAQASAMADEEWRRAKAAGNSKLLVCRDVDVDYSGVQVLFGVDFDVQEGEIVALLGTNGAGKSTLLRAIAGSRQASGGGIVFDGRDITHMPPHEIAGRGVVLMPGGRGIFPELSVLDNLMLGTWMVDDADEARGRLTEVFEIFPVLKDRADTEAGLLSGGEQQQLSLAQAFLTKPRLLLIDELSLGLSPAVVGQLLEIVREIHRRGVTIVIVEQSVNVALEIAEKAVFMEKGEVKFFGPTADLLARPDILRAVYVRGAGALTTQATRSKAGRDYESARPVLQVTNVVKRFGGINAVDDVSFDLREGEILGLIGPNGAGKTTLFDLLSGFNLPDSGHVVYEGVDITSATPEERARLGLVRRFQDAALFGSLTVYETLLVALDQQLEVRSTLMNAAALPGVRRSERRIAVRADRLVELLELGAFRDKFVKELSTGLRRVVDLACVLAAEPKVLLLDEPSTGIAQAEAENLGPLLRRTRFETGCSILIIEHDMPLISAVADELLALEQGATLMRGTPEEVLNDDRVVASYLGTVAATIQRSGST